MTFFFKFRQNAQILNLESRSRTSSLGLELQVSSLGLGVYDEVSSRNFNQVSVSKVTVWTTSMAVIIIQHDIYKLTVKNYS